VKDVVGNFVADDVVPDHLVGPVGQRVHLYQTEFLVPLDFVGSGAE
jgi:hypothetical protein